MLCYNHDYGWMLFFMSGCFLLLDLKIENIKISWNVAPMKGHAGLTVSSTYMHMTRVNLQWWYFIGTKIPEASFMAYYHMPYYLMACLFILVWMGLQSGFDFSHRHPTVASTGGLIYDLMWNWIKYILLFRGSIVPDFNRHQRMWKR